MVEGKARFTGAGQDWGVLGDRMDVFEKTPPHCLYLPDGTDWTATAETDYHRLHPKDGFRIQRVYSDDGSLDETMAVKDGDVVLVPRPPSLRRALRLRDVLPQRQAGPRRNWCFVPAPEVDWIMKRDV